jgi:biotin operon repressor
MSAPPRRKKWSEDDLVILIRMWNNNVGAAVIAERLNCTQFALRTRLQILRASGVPLAKRSPATHTGAVKHPWLQGEVKYLLRLRKEGKSVNDISTALNRSAYAVAKMLSRLKKTGINVHEKISGGNVRHWDPATLEST